MPAYGQNLYIDLEHGVLTLWGGETPAPGAGLASASQQLRFPLVTEAFTVSGFFSGAPGAFEIDVQAAAQDNDTEYQTIANGGIVSVDPTNNTFNLWVPP